MEQVPKKSARTTEAVRRAMQHGQACPGLSKGGIRFTDHAHHEYAIHHIVDRVCDENGIEHRLTRVKYPWTNPQSLPRRRPGSNG